MTVLDVAGWAMTAAPYIPGAITLSALIAVVYGAWRTAEAWRQRRAASAEAARVDEANKRVGDHLHHKPVRPGPLDHAYRQLEQLYQMPAWEDETQ